MALWNNGSHQEYEKEREEAVRPLREIETPTKAQLALNGIAAETKLKPILVLGATGRVGRLVVKRLVEEGIPVRAYVRDYEKALEVFQFKNDNDDDEEDGVYSYATVKSPSKEPPLTILIGDLAPDEDAYPDSNVEEDADIGYESLEDAIKGCSTVISCAGTVRKSQFTDFFPPWRIFEKDVSGWCRDKSHPYYVNYFAMTKIVQFVEKEQTFQKERLEQKLLDRIDHPGSSSSHAQDVIPDKVKTNIEKKTRIKIIRISDLNVGLPAWGIVSIFSNMLLSMVFRYQEMGERVLTDSKHVHSIILRPGDLVDEQRNQTTTSLHADTSPLPPPSIVGRSDVAALAVAFAKSDTDRSHTLSVRWAGQNLYPHQAQGVKDDGCADAKECVTELQRKRNEGRWMARGAKQRKLKPYGLYVGLMVYTVLIVVGRIAVVPVSGIRNFLSPFLFGLGNFGRRFFICGLRSIADKYWNCQGVTIYVCIA